MPQSMKRSYNSTYQSSPGGSPKVSSPKKKSPAERAHEIAKKLQHSPPHQSAVRQTNSSVANLLHWSGSPDQFSKSLPIRRSPRESPVKLNTSTSTAVTFPSYQKQENEKGLIQQLEHKLLLLNN